MSPNATDSFDPRSCIGNGSAAVKTNFSKLSKIGVSLFCYGLFILLPVGFSGVSQAQAATYYVSNTATNGYVVGVDGNNGTSKATPKLTLSGAHTAAASGDIIVMNNGTYTLAAAFGISKGITVIPETDYGVTITTTALYPIGVTIADGSTFTMGRIILDGDSTNTSYGLSVPVNATLFSIVLNGTRIQDVTRRAIHGGTSNNINFTANDIEIDYTHGIATNADSAIVLDNLASGSVHINGGTVTLDTLSTSSLGGVFIKAIADGVTASVEDMTLNLATASASASPGAIKILNVPDAVISGNVLNVSNIPGVELGYLDGIVVSSYTPYLDASNPIVSDNIINMNSTAMSHLIMVGEDSSDASSSIYNKVNGAKVYGNHLNGNTVRNAGLPHGLMIGNVSDAEVYDNVVDNVAIGLLAKGGSNSVFHHNLVTNVYRQYIRSKASAGTKFYNNTAIVSAGNAQDCLYAGLDDVYTPYHQATDIVFENNLIYGSVAPTRFAYVDVDSSATFIGNEYYSPAAYNFYYEGTTYADTASWQAARESDAVAADPLFTDYSGGDYTLTYPSPAIDAGTAIVGITTDRLGNHIYGAPDIGNYEYQPPYVIGTDDVNVSRPVRIYADGKYRYIGTTSGSTDANLSIAPQAGFGAGDYSQWLDVAIDTWNVTGDYYKKWTESSDDHTLATSHTVGDLRASTKYLLKVDGVITGVYTSDVSGEIDFVYSGGYTTKTFELIEDTSTPAAFTLVSPADNTATPDQTPVFSWNASSDDESGLAKYQLYIDGVMDQDNISSSATSVSPSAEIASGEHTWYMKAVDHVGTGTDSDTFDLIVDTGAPAAFTLVSPADNSITSNQNPLFSWHTSSDSGAGLAKYQLYIDGVMDKDNILASATSTSPSTALVCGDHTWYAKALDNAGNATNSATFNLEMNCGSGCIVPTKPDVSAVNFTVGGGIDNLPEDIAQIAVSATADFAGVSWEDITRKGDLLEGHQGAAVLYLKFRTQGGAVSDVVEYLPKANADVTLNDGDIVKTADSPDVYIIKYKNGKQYKRLVLSPLVFRSYGHLKWENLKIVPQAQLDRYVTSSLVKETLDAVIYLLFPDGDVGERRPLDTTGIYDQDSIYEINKTDRDTYKLTK